jgi:hypothetical protein
MLHWLIENVEDCNLVCLDILNDYLTLLNKLKTAIIAR